jgi:hypothetical protein
VPRVSRNDKQSHSTLKIGETSLQTWLIGWQTGTSLFANPLEKLKISMEQAQTVTAGQYGNERTSPK